MSATESGALPETVEIYDTTLRDGAQLEGISLTVDDKLRIAEQLDRLGVHYIEGGWPGANPKDVEFFQRAATELDLEHSKLVAFGSTRRVGGDVEDDVTLGNLLDAGTDVVCIVGKCSAYHVTEALRTGKDEGVAMVADSVRFLKSHGRTVFFDAEHFFDGYADDPEFSLRVLTGAAEAGADCLVLCDTNGGSLPSRIESMVRDVVAAVDCAVGVHLHNDTGCGVANALAGVAAGATHVQGTINGYGERVGNCDLVPIIANLTLKMGVETLPEGHLAELTPVAHHVAELVNFAADPQQPYVGATAFAHKAGLHTSAIARRRDAYEHVAPELVGNGTRFLVSEMSGRSTIELKATQLGIELDAKPWARSSRPSRSWSTPATTSKPPMHPSNCSCEPRLVGNTATSSWSRFQSTSAIGPAAGAGPGTRWRWRSRPKPPSRSWSRVSVSWPSARAMVRSTPSTPHSGLRWLVGIRN
ncbi:MAG: hypothetical protein CM1200mP26_22970 [Acidimicrobiales bacterium]|nr:MAG: hypothetical protein CM1200mP26_22970 [Acidimicrobiales bacterium]